MTIIDKSFITLFLTTCLCAVSCSKVESGILGSGYFEADETLISSEVNGKIISWIINEGDNVEEGTTVGIIDTTQLYLQKLALLKSGKAVTSSSPSVSTQTAALQTRLKDLESQRARVEKLVKGGAATQKELEDLETGIALAQNQLLATQSTLVKSNAQISAQSSAIDVQIAQVDDLIKRSILKAPLTGTVLSTFTKKGELTGQGRPLYRLADLRVMTLKAYLTLKDLSALQLGDTVVVKVDGSQNSKREYKGKIMWISSEAEFTPKTVQTRDERENLVYALKISVPNDGYLRIGMYGEVLAPKR